MSMKKCFLSLIMILVLSLTLFACKEDTDETSTTQQTTEQTTTEEPVVDYGELIINDISVELDRTIEISPTFTKTAGEGTITYTFEGDDIEITEGVVKGLTGGTKTIVTATTEHHEITFEISVTFPFNLGDNTYTETSQSNAFRATASGVYTKISDPYAETFYYENNEALAGEKYMLSGSIALTEALDNGQSMVIVKGAEDKVIRFVLEYLPGGTFSIFTDFRNESEFQGYRIIHSNASSELNFTLIVSDGVTYFFVDDVLYGKVQEDIGASHAGFAGEKGITTISNLSSTSNEEAIDDYLAPIFVNFGEHASGTTGADEDVFVKQEDGSFFKESTTYQQSFYYEDGRAIAGEAFTISGTLQLNGTAAWSQAIIVLAKDDDNMIRFVLERTDDGKYQLFRDQKVDGSFGNWGLILSPENRDNFVNFSVAYKEEVTYLFLDDELVATLNVDLGEPHIGFASDKATISLSNLQGSLDASRVEKVINNTPFDANIYTGHTDVNVFERDEDGSFIKKNKNYQQTFYYLDDQALAGEKYMISGKMELLNPVHTGQGIITIMNNEAHLMRFVLERYESFMQVFTDHKNDSEFTGWKLLTSNSSGDYNMEFTVIVDNDTYYFLIDDVLLHQQTLEIGETHLGFAGEKTEMKISNLQASLDAAAIDDKIAAITQSN